MATKEHKVAYYWAVYYRGVKQGTHPSKGYDELQLCTFYAKYIFHKQYYGQLEDELRAVKLLKINKNYTSALSIFENISNNFYKLTFDSDGFVVYERNEKISQSKEEVSVAPLIYELENQTEIDFGNYEFKRTKMQFQEDWD